MALFSACSTSDDLTADIPPSSGLSEEEKALIIEAGKDSDVPITLGSVGSSRATTRTPIDSDGGDLFVTPAGQYLGVFCLAQGIQAGAPDIDAIPDTDADVKWNGTCQHANWLENIPAEVCKHTSGDPSPIGGGGSQDYSYIQFKTDDFSGNKIYYYPFGNWYHYDFFAYYPRQASVTTIAKSSYVDFTITGKEDIIWAHAAGGASIIDAFSGNDVKSYSSKYIRLKKESGSEEIDVVPSFSFKHKLTQLTFSVKPHAADANSLFTKGFAVTGMELQDVYYNLHMVVASKTEETTDIAGTLSIPNTTSVYSVTDIPVWNPTDDSDPFNGGTVSFPVANSSSDTSTKGIGYMLVPPSNMIAGTPHHHFLLNIHMSQTSGDPVPDTVITLQEPTDDVDGDGNPDGFAAGHKYNITIEIYNPTNIQATATLADWNDEAETVIGVD